MVIELLAVLQDGAYGKDLDGKDENGKIALITWATSSLPLTPITSWVRS